MVLAPAEKTIDFACELLNTAMERVAVLAVRIYYITRSRGQSSLLVEIQRKKDV
jgi:hypothetical protein